MKINWFGARSQENPAKARQTAIALVLLASITASAAGAWLHDGICTHEFLLAGCASGGTLAVTRLLAQDAKFIVVPTVAGETGEEVAARISAAGLSVDGMYVTNSSNSILAEGLQISAVIALAGTETGFGIPATPKSLSANYDATGEGVNLCWEGVSDYDLLLVHSMGHGVAGIRDANNCVYVPSEKYHGSPHRTYFHIIAYKDSVPSNAARVLMRLNSQEDMTWIPFTDGVWPNWTKWNLPGQDAVSVSQSDRNPNPSVGKGGTLHISDADFAPFYQGLSADGSSYSGGIYRRFLGLESGGTYRLAARLNTFSQIVSTNWTYSVHAAHSAVDNALLTPQQLAGSAALPDGSQGPTAGRIGAFGASDTTEGFWIECATDGNAPGKAIGNITIPQDVTSLTVWVRLTGADTTVDEVGIDWVAIEKLESP